MTTEEPNDTPVVRDRRRIDPDTGELRDLAEPGPAAGRRDQQASAAVPAEKLAAAEQLAEERLNDLKRVQAEYMNYRKRVDRDREVVREQAVASVLGELLGVLDDVGRARDHGDLTGGFRSVGEALEAVTAKLGLVKYGEPGDVFDPSVHEALMHEYSDEVTEPTCTQVLMPGYRLGERIIRPARVAVAEPTVALSGVLSGDAGDGDGDTDGREQAPGDEGGDEPAGNGGNGSVDDAPPADETND